MRWISIALTLCCVAASQASFELLLIPDSNGRLQRVDPVSRVSLGSFMTFFGARAAHVTGLNEVYVGGSSGMTRFNYSTGSQTRAFAFAAFTSGFASNGSALFGFTTGNQVRRYDLGPGVLAGITGPLDVTLFQPVNRGGVSGFAYGRDSSNRIVTQVMSSAGVVGGPTTLTGLTSATSTMGAVTHFRGLDFFAYRDGGLTRLFYGTGTTYLNNPNNLTTLFGSGITPAVVAGHENLYMIGASSTTGSTRILRFGTDSPVFSTVLMDNFEMNFTPATDVAPGIVVAPEPGTIAALAGGVAIFLRRKRKSA